MIVVLLSGFVDIFCCLSTVHEHDSQTDRQTNHRMVTSIAID